jgi:RNA-directed DNA polymerase
VRPLRSTQTCTRQVGLVGASPLSSNFRSPAFFHIFAHALLAGEQSPDAVAARLAETLGREWDFLRPLARRYLKEFAGQARPRLRAVVRFLQQDEPLRRACGRHAASLHLAQWTTDPQRMAPVVAARDWPLPAIETVAELSAWLGLTPSELEWLADRKHLTSKRAVGPEGTSLLHHYHYRVLVKPQSPRQPAALRLIEVPKPRLKHLQRRVLHEILDRIPGHDAVHGFRRGRSIATFAAPHTSRQVVLRMDLQDFFPSFSAGRIQSFFRAAGYPEAVADLLAALCTNAAPRGLWKSYLQSRHGERGVECAAEEPVVSLSKERASALYAAAFTARNLYAQAHLPQGAPASPALANCLCYRLDCRLAGLAEAAGATYTRYADDLAFSGDGAFARRAERFALHVAAILHEEGLAVHHRKTRVMRSGVRQHLAGVVINRHVNPPRPDYDRLKATLTNCLRHGPASQNRDAIPGFRAHLEGRIAFIKMLNPGRAAKLRRLFDQIDWG